MAVECPEDSDQFSTFSLKSTCSPAASQRVKRWVGARYGCCTAVNLQWPNPVVLVVGGPHRPTDQEFELMRCEEKSSLLGETEMWVYHACCPAYYLVLFPKGEWLHRSCKIAIMDSQGQRDCPSHLLQTTSTLAKGERSRPLNNCANTGWSPVWCAWLEMCTEKCCDKRPQDDLSRLGTT